MDYSRFKELMGQADDLLGGGSNYAVDSLIGYGTVPLTYEEAKERYDLAVSSDQVTGGYARLFSDYAGVMVLSILPVFLAVILSMKEQACQNGGTYLHKGNIRSQTDLHTLLGACYRSHGSGNYIILCIKHNGLEQL